MRYPETMLRAEQLIYTDPDSAYILLADMKDSLLTHDKPVYMYYHLLSMETGHCNDSLLPAIIAYYEKFSDEDKLSRAYYQMGKQKSDHPMEALEYLQKALKRAETKSSHLLSGRIRYEIGQVYLSQQVKEELLPNLKSAYHHQQIAGDSLYQAMTLQILARAYRMNRYSMDSVEMCYERSYEIACQVGDSAILCSIERELACHYMQQKKNYPLIKNLLVSGERYARTHQMAPFNLEWAGYYSSQDNQDSAIYFYKQFISQPDIENRSGVAQSLARLLLQKGSYEEARYYQSIYDKEAYDYVQKMATDSIRLLKTEQYTKQQNQLAELQDKQSRWPGMVLVILIVTGLFVSGIYYYRSKYRTKSNTPPNEVTLPQSPILTLFCQAVHDESIKLTDEDWYKLQQFIDENYDHFTDRLYACYPLSPIELRICLLLKIAISITGIARLINRSKSSVTSARRKLHEKLLHEPGTPEMLDQYILSL